VSKDEGAILMHIYKAVGVHSLVLWRTHDCPFIPCVHVLLLLRLDQGGSGEGGRVDGYINLLYLQG
jgi:hypothetical protein